MASSSIESSSTSSVESSSTSSVESSIIFPEFMRLLETENKSCYDWFISMGDHKKKKIIECTFDIMKNMNNPYKSSSYGIGLFQENCIESILLGCQYPFEKTAKKSRSGDFIVNHRNIKIMIECKSYANAVPYTEVEKLIRDMQYCEIKYAIFISQTNIARIENRMQFVNIEGNYIYFINIENQPVEMIGNIIDMCISSFTSSCVQMNEINDTIIETVKNLSESMTLLHEFTNTLSNTKLLLIKQFELLEKKINIYEFEVRKNIRVLTAIAEPVKSDKEKLKQRVMNTSDAFVKNFMCDIIEKCDDEVFETDSYIIIKKLQFEIKPRKSWLRYKTENGAQQINSDWEFKNKIISIPINNNNKEHILNLLQIL